MPGYLSEMCPAGYNDKLVVYLARNPRQFTSAHFPQTIIISLGFCIGEMSSCVSGIAPGLFCRMRWLILTIFGSLSIELPAEESPRAAPGERRVYKQSGGEDRGLELFFPPDRKPGSRAPGLILFHGGGWRGGSPRQFRETCAYFASRGLVCATAEYRMLNEAEQAELPEGESRKRVCIADAKSAIRWMKRPADKLGVDPDRIVAGGGSAGAHISALATLNPGLDDPSDPIDSTEIDTSVVAYLWFNPAFSPEDAGDPEVNVLNFVEKGLAPALVFFGTEDWWLGGWNTAHARWREAGNKSIHLRFAEGEKHGFFTKEPWRSITLVEADRFLAELGLIDGPPTREDPSTEEVRLRWAE